MSRWLTVVTVVAVLLLAAALSVGLSVASDELRAGNPTRTLPTAP